MAKITKTYGELLGLVQTMNALGSNRASLRRTTKSLKTSALTMPTQTIRDALSLTKREATSTLRKVLRN
jgi:hypothetical protein